MADRYRNWLRTLGAPEDPVATDTSSDWSAMSLLKAVYGRIGDIALFLQSGVGAVTRTLRDKMRDIINAKDFGVVADGVTNDVAAINLAIVACNARGGGIVDLPPGVIAVGGTHIALMDKVHLRGAGQGRTVLTLLSSFDDYIVKAFTGGTMYDLGISDLSINAGDFYTSSSSAAIFAQSVNKFFAERITITKMGRFGIVVQGAIYSRVNDNIISATTAVNTQSQGIIFTVALANANCEVHRNKLINTGMEIDGAHGSIIRNYVSGHKFGGGITCGPHVNTHHLTISGNICTGSRGQDINLIYPAGIECWATESIVSDNICYDNSGNGIMIGGKRSVCVDNTCYDNGVSAGAAEADRAGIHAQYSTATFSAIGSVFHGNLCYNTLGGAGTQSYGYVENASVTDIVLGTNKFDTNRLGPVSLTAGTFANAQNLPSLTLGWAGVLSGLLNFVGTTSGLVTVKSIIGTYNFNLPTTAGTSGLPLLSGGGGAAAQTYGQIATAAITDANVTFAKIQDLTGLSVIGRAASGAAGVVAAITGAADQFFGVNAAGTALGFQTMGGDVVLSGPTATIASNAVANSKFRQSAALSLVGVTGNATANVADITAGSDFQIMRRSGTAIGFGSIDLSNTGAVGSSVLPVANGGTGTSQPNLASYVPVPRGSGGGTITAHTTIGAYFQVGKLVFFTVQVGISNVGTATGILYVTLPVTAGATYGVVMSGNESQTTGNMCMGVIDAGATEVYIRQYNGVDVLATNYTTKVSGWYRSA